MLLSKQASMLGVAVSSLYFPMFFLIDAFFFRNHRKIERINIVNTRVSIGTTLVFTVKSMHSSE